MESQGGDELKLTEEDMGVELEVSKRDKCRLCEIYIEN